MNILIGIFSISGIFLLVFFGSAILKDVLKTGKSDTPIISYKMNWPTAIGLLIVVLFFMMVCTVSNSALTN